MYVERNGNRIEYGRLGCLLRGHLLGNSSIQCFSIKLDFCVFFLVFRYRRSTLCVLLQGFCYTFFFSFFFISFNHYLLPKSVYHCMSLIWEGSSFSIFLVDENGFVIRFMMELDLFLTLDDDDGGTDAARSAPLSLGSFNFFINE